MFRIINISTDSVKRDACIPGVDVYNEKEQISKINKLFLGEEFEGYNEIIKCIKCKLSSYKTQDRKKNIFNSNNFITYTEILEKLVVSKLKCDYCRGVTLLMYTDRREKRQWTLDRIDNSTGHTGENTVICCLECNLQRRCTNDKKFKFTKQMRIIKHH